MEVMVTFNISTDLNVANSAHGHIVDIVLDPQEDVSNNPLNTIKLQHPSMFL